MIRPKASLVAAASMLLAACFAVALVYGPRLATADHERAQGTERKVTAHLGVQFSTKRCEGDRAYKINAVSRRWHRMRLRRQVEAAFLTRARGLKCNSRHTSIAHDRNGIRPCFGCDGYPKRWTPDLFSQYRWPYVREVFADNSIGAVLFTRVKSRGEFIGEPICLKIVLAGHMDSPFC